MANNVFANGREIVCKAGDGKTICAFPDVCFTPPDKVPPTPPGVPIPYPNTGFAKDTTNGSKNVKISKKEVLLKNKSYYKTSTGDEAGCATKKGILTSKTKGKVYFNAWSMDVKVEGENVARHLDLTTHNHGSGGQTPPFPDLDAMEVGGQSCKSIFRKEHMDVHRHGDKECPKGYESDHVLQNACFENKRAAGGISSCPKYAMKDAPCICLKGKSTEQGSQHYKKTQSQRNSTKAWRKAKKKSIPYSESRDEGLEAVADSRSKRPSKAAMECLRLVVDHYFKKHCGLKEGSPVRVPRSGKFRRPNVG